MATSRKPAAIFIFITLVLAIMGVGLILPVLPGLITQFEGGDVAEASHVYGWMVGIFALMQFFGSPILGALSDRFGRRRGFVLAGCVAVVAMTGYGFATQGWMIYAILVFASIAGIGGPALQSYVTRHVPANEQGSLQGAFGSLLRVAGIVAPPVAAWSFGWAIDPANALHIPGLPFFESAALLAIALVLAVRSFNRENARGRTPA